MKKVLLIGSSYSALDLLFELKKMNFKVSVCGAYKDDPCHFYSEESFYIDYSNPDNLLKLLEKNNFDFIVPSCNDFAYMSATYVANKLGFIGFDTIKTANIIHKKDNYRKFLEKEKLNSPLHSSITNISNLNYPLLVKPVDSFSGKGISKIYNNDELKVAIQTAKRASKFNEAVIEEFKEGTLHSHSAFLKNGEIFFEVFVDEFCTVYPYQVDSSCVSNILSKDIKIKVSKSINDLANKLMLVDGLIHTQFIVENDNFWLIESMRRCPGDLYSRLIHQTLGLNYNQLYIAPFISKQIVVKTKEHILNIARHTISVNREYAFTSFAHNIPAEDVQIIPLKKSGEKLNIAPNDKLAILFATFKTKQLLQKYTPKLLEYIKIKEVYE